MGISKEALQASLQELLDGAKAKQVRQVELAEVNKGSAHLYSQGPAIGVQNAARILAREYEIQLVEIPATD